MKSASGACRASRDSSQSCSTAPDEDEAEELDPEAADEDPEAQRNLTECRELLATGAFGTMFDSPDGREPYSANLRAVVDWLDALEV